ncbi:MFS transporter [Zooshikella ganghwensis]|uniref:MFS transporter n=1 Tax=Zooshikella ganghwensis TaxID=202772 RepID=A0A4P9VQU8_9GAMM|nr:MFS transporter [Zooshikella ganghwensis]RDH44430.1 MFS transporter [Zooshikella ganghwensis]
MSSDSPPNTVPVRSLASVYGWYFVILGILVPYWAPYLQSQGFSSSEIGILLAILMATKVIAPLVWGLLADYFFCSLRLVRIGTLCSVVAFAGVFGVDAFWPMAFVMACFSFFWNAVLPLFEVITLRFLVGQTQFYSRIRLWGSIGFIVAVLGVGGLLDLISLDWVPWLCWLAFWGLWLASLALPMSAKKTSGTAVIPPHKMYFRMMPVVGFFAVAALVQLAHGPYYTFFSIHLQNHGYSHTAIGSLWALGVLAEVILFLFMHQLLPKLGVRNCLMLGLLGAALRWFMIGWWADSLVLITLAQLLHALSFGACHAASIEFVHRQFPEGLAGRGQALYSGISFGLGAGLGALAAGYGWESLGAAMTFSMASLVCVLGLWLTYVALPQVR